MIARKWQTWLRDKRGATIVEFAFVAPVLILTIMGILDIGYRGYTTAMLQGAVQKASRDSALETGAAQGANIDNGVKSIFETVAPRATYEFKRANYESFSDVSKPEDYTDTNGDGSCNDGEPFEDVNDNGSWDADRGRTGQGDARDAVLYTVTATYPRLFPLAAMIGLPENEAISASTVLRNQPFNEQANRTPVQGNCT